MAGTSMVHRAAKVMDKVVPGWHQRVDIECLDMSDCSMCMLSQTFGSEAEMAIGKELYPEEWKQALDDHLKDMNGAIAWEQMGPGRKEAARQYSSARQGYQIGLKFFKNKFGSVPAALHSACSGNYSACKWIEEIAERRAADEQQKEQQTHG